MSKTIVVSALLALLAVWSGPAAADGGFGGQPGAYLRVPMGARAIGLGGAFVGVADDPSALYWNVGGIAQVGSAVQLSASAMSLDRFHYQGTVVFSAGQVGSFGVLWNSLRVSDIEIRDISGNLGGRFDDTENVIMVGWARQYWEHLGVGGAVKYYQHSLASNTGSGAGFDLGVHLGIPLDSGFVSSMSIGASASDLHGRLEWDTDAGTAEDIPATYRLGLAVGSSIVNRPCLLALAYSATDDEEDWFSLGYELWIHEAVAMRVGGGRDNISYGATFSAGGFQLDYSYSDDVLERGGTSTVSVNYGFQGPRHRSQSPPLELPSW